METPLSQQATLMHFGQFFRSRLQGRCTGTDANSLALHPQQSDANSDGQALNGASVGGGSSTSLRASKSTVITFPCRPSAPQSLACTCSGASHQKGTTFAKETYYRGQRDLLMIGLSLAHARSLALQHGDKRSKKNKTGTRPQGRRDPRPGDGPERLPTASPRVSRWGLAPVSKSR